MPSSVTRRTPGDPGLGADRKAGFESRRACGSVAGMTRGKPSADDIRRVVARHVTADQLGLVEDLGPVPATDAQAYGVYVGADSFICWHEDGAWRFRGGGLHGRGHYWSEWNGDGSAAALYRTIGVSVFRLNLDSLRCRTYHWFGEEVSTDEWLDIDSDHGASRITGDSLDLGIEMDEEITRTITWTWFDLNQQFRIQFKRQGESLTVLGGGEI